MLVKDIYGGSYASLGLTGDLIASSFGKSATADKGCVFHISACLNESHFCICSIVIRNSCAVGVWMNCLYKRILILEFSKEDMSKSLLHMISNDIGQLACLYAKLHNLSRVYFGGFFIRGHPVTMHTITYSINFFTKARFSPFSDKIKALFRSGTGQC